MISQSDLAGMEKAERLCPKVVAGHLYQLPMDNW